MAWEWQKWQGFHNPNILPQNWRSWGSFSFFIAQSTLIWDYCNSQIRHSNQAIYKYVLTLYTIVYRIGKITVEQTRNKSDFLVRFKWKYNKIDQSWSVHRDTGKLIRELIKPTSTSKQNLDIESFIDNTRFEHREKQSSINSTAKPYE